MSLVPYDYFRDVKCFNFKYFHLLVTFDTAGGREVAGMFSPYLQAELTWSLCEMVNNSLKSYNYKI